MNSSEGQLRFLKIYTIFSSVAIAVLLLAGFQKADVGRHKFEEIDVQRINVVEPNGKLDLVISSEARFPDPIVNGKTGHRNGKSPGMLFYNSLGDEDGGLVFGAEVHDGKYEASAGLLFDQYKQDQTVGVVYEDQNGSRRAGLVVWDRPAVPLDQLLPKWEEIKNMPDGPEKPKAIQAMKDRGELGATRLFVGKSPEKSSQLVLFDVKGKPRLKITVDSAGNPTMKFLDEQGNETYALPPKTDKK